MALWSGKTDLWGRKTRHVELPPPKKTNGHDDHVEKDEDYLETEDKIMALEAQVKFYQDRVLEKCQEIAALNKRLEDSTNFMQTVVLELIQMKNYRPAPTAEVKPVTALEKYIAKKNSDATEAKLP